MYGEKGFEQHILLGTHFFKLSASHPFLWYYVGIFLSPIFPFICFFYGNCFIWKLGGGVLPPPNLGKKYFVSYFFHVFMIFKGIRKVSYVVVAWLWWIYISFFYILRKPIFLPCSDFDVCPSGVTNNNINYVRW